MSINLGGATGYLDLDTSKFKGALKEAQDKMNEVTSNMSSKVGKAMTSVGDSMYKAGSTMTKFVTTPIVGVGTASVKTAATFESSMSKVKALSGAAGDDFEKLNNKAKEMGATTRYSASEAADALGFMALAGWNTQQMVDGLDGVLNLAAASDMDLAQASDIVTDYLSAFGLEASKAGKLADEMAYAQAHSNTSTIQLSEAFKNSAANMHAAGQSMETTTAILEAFANQGTKGAHAGTQLAAIMRDVTNKMDNGAITIGKTKIAVKDANGNFRDMIDIMADVENATNGMGSAEKAAALSSVFTANSINGVNQILTEGTGKIRGYKKELEGAGGTAKEMADEMLNNLNGQLTILKSALEGLAIEIGERLMPYVKQGVEWVQKMVEKFQSLSTEQKDQIIKWAGIVAAIGPALMVGGKFISILGKIIGTFNKLKGAFVFAKTLLAGLGTSFSAVALPIIAIVAAIATLGAAFKNLWDTNKEFRNKIKAIWIDIQRAFKAAFISIGKSFSSMKESFGEILTALKPVWDKFCQLLAPVFVKAFDVIRKVLVGAVRAIAKFIEVLAKVLKYIAKFSKNPKKNFNELKKTITNFAKNAKTKAKSFTKDFVDKIVNGIKSLPNKFKNKLDEVVKNIKAWGKQIASNAKASATKFLNNVINGIKSLPSKMLQIFNNAISRVKDWANQMLSNAKTAASNFLNNFINGVTSLPSRLWQLLTDAFNKVKLWAMDLATKATTAGMDFFNNIWSQVKGLPDKFTSLGGDIVRGVWTGISSLWDWLKTKVTNWAINILNAAKNALQVNSPSKKFENELGVWLPAGTAKGFEKAMPAMTKRISDSLNGGLEYVQKKAKELTVAAKYVVTGESSFEQKDMALKVRGGIDYSLLSQSMIDVLRTAPIQNNFSVEMEDGDVLLDNERVGRKVAPVVSRVVAKDIKFA